MKARFGQECTYCGDDAPIPPLCPRCDSEMLRAVERTEETGKPGYPWEILVDGCVKAFAIKPDDLQKRMDWQGRNGGVVTVRRSNWFGKSRGGL